MTHEDAVSFISAGVEPGGNWADLGAGSGRFTGALSELLGPAGSVVAVDRNAGVLRQIAVLSAPGAAVRTLHADFTGPLGLTDLDGLLLANSLHFVMRQLRALRRLTAHLKPRGRLLVVEYDHERRSPWNPYPVPLERFGHLSVAAGLSGPRELNRRPSRFSGRELYLAVAVKP